MANETAITVIGNLTADPELRYTSSGAPVVNFRVATTPRTFDRNTNTWKDGTTAYLGCSAWREYAEHVAATLKKGMRVIVYGNLVQNDYTDKDGNPRSSMEIQVEEVGPSLRYATAQVVAAPRKDNAPSQSGYQQAPVQQPAQAPVQPQGGYQQAPVQQPAQAPVQPQAPAQQPAQTQPQGQFGGQFGNGDF